MKKLNIRTTSKVNIWKERYNKFVSRACAKISCAKGQGTTEYAILVGVLVVIAIIAISAFRPQLSSLWDAIKDNIKGIEIPS